MGYDVRHAIVVTGFTPHLKDAHVKASQLFTDDDGWDLVSAIVGTAANGWRTFSITPDGGKNHQGWSNDGDRRRAEFVAYLKNLEDEDRQSPLAWVEVQYGDDFGDTRIVNDSDATFRAQDDA